VVDEESLHPTGCRKEVILCDLQVKAPIYTINEGELYYIEGASVVGLGAPLML